MSARRRSADAARIAAAIALALACVAGGARDARAQDPVFSGDFVDPATSEIVELVPGAPWVLPDASVVPNPQAIGDVDLVVRTGLTGFAGAIPPTSPLRIPSAVPIAIAEPAGAGASIPVVVAISDGTTPPAEGMAIVSPELEGDPVLVIAFADLDGDGFVGVTALDGDPNDETIEEQEIAAVGRRFGFFASGQAPAQLFVGVAGPDEAPLRIVATAVAYVGATSPSFFGGVVPDGPAVMTRLPALLRTDPDDVIDGNLPGPPGENEPVGVEVTDHFTPDPVRDDYGEAFTLVADGSDATTDVADAKSGAVASFGLARLASSATYDSATGHPLRPGLDAAGARAVLEMLNPLVVDTGAGVEAVRIVPTDRLGNVATLGTPTLATLRAGPGLAIRAPDADADPTKETLLVLDTRGVGIDLEGAGALSVELVPEPSAIALQAGALAALAALRARRRRGRGRAHGGAR